MPYLGHFPEREIEKSGNTFAIFAAESGGLFIKRIRTDRGRQFHCEYGVFQLDKKYRYSCRASDIYCYDQRNQNPISIFGLIDTQLYLRHEKKSSISITDLKTVVSTASIIEDEAQFFKTQTNMVEKLRTKTILWLNDYYNEDVVAKIDLLGSAMHKEKFKNKHSKEITPWMPQEATKVTDIAMVVIDDRSIEIETDVTPILDDKSGLFKIRVGHYGTFIVRDTKTRYRYKKNNVYIVAVQTTTPEAAAFAAAGVVKGKTKGSPETLDTPEAVNKQFKSVVDEIIEITNNVKKLQSELKSGKVTQEEIDSEPSPMAENPELIEDVEYTKLIIQAKKKVIITRKRKKLEELGLRRTTLIAKKDEIQIIKTQMDAKYGSVAAAGSSGGNGHGKGLFKRGKKQNPQKRRLVPIYGYKPYFEESVSINATVYVPKMNMLDPLLAENIVRSRRYLKIKKDLVSNPIKKSPVNVQLVMIIGFLIIIGMAIVWSVIVQPQLQRQAQFDLEKERLRASGQPIPEQEELPPNIGGFPIPSIPGFG